MTQPCQHCGQPSEEPTCIRCRAEHGRIGGYPAWSNASNEREAGARHERRITETRQHLSELPDLYAQLGLFRLPGSAPQDPDQRSGRSNPAWRSVVNLDVVDLTDVREKAYAEPTRTDYEEDRRAGARRQGVLPTLSSWVRLVDSELWDSDLEHEPQDDEPTVSGECGYLLRQMEWIAQQPWFIELHDDVTKIRADVRHAIGDRDAIGYECSVCGWAVVPRYGQSVYVCTGCEKTWTMANEIDAFVAKQVTSMSIGDCAKEIDRPVGTLHHWRKEGWITPVAWDRQKKRDLYDLRMVKRAAETIKNGKRVNLSA